MARPSEAAYTAAATPAGPAPTMIIVVGQPGRLHVDPERLGDLGFPGSTSTILLNSATTGRRAGPRPAARAPGGLGGVAAVEAERNAVASQDVADLWVLTDGSSPITGDVVVAMRIARCAAAFAITGPGIQTRCLEGVGVQGHPVAAAARISASAVARSLAPRPNRAGRLAPRAGRCSRTRPGPPVEPGVQVTVIPADGHTQHAAIVVAGDGGIEHADLLIKAFGEASVGIADSEAGLRSSVALLPRGRRTPGDSALS